jgi:hypothetical protein
MSSHGASLPFGPNAGLIGGLSGEIRHLRPWRSRRQWQPPAGLDRDGRIFHCALDDEHEPSVLRWTHEIRRYPFAGKIDKEPLDFFRLEPAVLSVLSEIRFRVLKAYFLPDKSKIRFQVFTVLPLELFWS